MKQIAIFSSGNGTNAENIIQYFSNHPKIKVALVISNKIDAYVHVRAKNLGVASYSFSNETFKEGVEIAQFLSEHEIDFIVLAGFMIKVPDAILRIYRDKIINIHPALLPKYGGKGMYGDNVHKKVVEMKETQSGITIHYVNERYDEGEIIFQASCEIHPFDNYEDVAKKIHTLEYEHFPRIVEEVCLKLQ